MSYEGAIEPDSSNQIRVTLVQPALPKYRVSVFRELAQRPGINLTVVYGSVPNLTNAAPDGFHAEYSSRSVRKIAGRDVMFHLAEWTYCSRRYSDVVVLRWGGNSAYLLPGILRAKAHGVPVVLWGHGYSKQEHKWSAGFRNWVATLADAIVFYDPKTRDSFLEKGWDRAKLFVALNAIDHEPIDAASCWWRDHPNEFSRFRAENELHRGPTMLYVSRLTPANRLDLLLKATAVLKDDFPHMRTVIVGNGADERLSLERLAKELDISNNVLFVDGIYEEFELAPWFMIASVFCYPANIGLSLIHAFWYGLPVVTSDDTAVQNPEIVALAPGVNGAVFRHANVSSLTNVLRNLLTDEAVRVEMSRAARTTVEGRYTIQHMVDGLEEAIHYALQNSSRKAIPSLNSANG